MTTPDNLFRDRLAGFQKSPPPNAWNRVSTGLQNNRRRKIWYRLAAMVLLLALVGIAFVSLKKESQPTHPAKPVLEIKAPVMAHTPSSQVDSNTVAETHKHEKSADKAAIKKETAHHHSNTVISHDTQVAVKKQADVASEENTLTATVIPESKTEMALPVQSTASLIEDAVADVASGKIVYTAADVNARFRRKKEIPTDTIAKPPSGLQKVVALAYGFKNDNTMLGDLRHMKNELFSIPGKKSSRVQ